MSLSQGQCATILRSLGWRVATTGQYAQAVKDFQRGWNLGPVLGIDGAVGPMTSAALVKSEANRRAGQGSCSAHFSFDEFACQCGGRFANCRRIWILRAQVQSLEAYRSHAGSVHVVSGCRCPDHNKAVGGASGSQHMFGSATDIAKNYTPARIGTWRIFAGLGFGASSGLTCHVDRRDCSGNNPSGGSLTTPTTWRYSSW